MHPQPLPNDEATRIIRRLARRGAVSFSQAAEADMARHELAPDEVLTVLRRGWVQDWENVDGMPRYRMRTLLMLAPVIVTPDKRLVVVEAARAD